MVKTESIEVLVRLIDDPDEYVFAHVRSRLLEAGEEAIDYLVNSIDVLTIEAETYSRIQRLIHELQFNRVKNELIDWINSTEKDVLKGMCSIARYQYPDLDDNLIEEQIASIEQRVWIELNGKLTSYEIVKTINKVLFDVLDFKGVENKQHTPYHSLINTVLEECEGTPLSLSVLYSVIAQRLDIPVYGVAFPSHFILAYMDEFRIHRLLSPEGNGGILFYIDPYAKGEFLSKENLEESLDLMMKTPRREYFEPCSHTAILVRTLNNLILAFTQQGKMEKVAELNELKQLFRTY
jgi:regulator of sirC expression with transglutaminase-like and TPR domain